MTPTTPTTPTGQTPRAIILAAGKGTRMGGDLPKVLYPVAEKPLVWWVVKACQEAGVSRCILVVGYRSEAVKSALADQDHCVFVEQHEQLGTGHATRMAQPLFENQPPNDVFVLPGDAPLIQSRTLAKLLEHHRQSGATATLATARLDNPDGYGRIVRQPGGALQAIVEQKDATPQQKQINEINTGYYCFRSDRLFDCLSRVSDANAQNEYYLTDVPGLLTQAGEKIAIVDAVAPEEVMGVNNPQQLAQVDQVMRARLGTPPLTDRQTRESA